MAGFVDRQCKKNQLHPTKHDKANRVNEKKEEENDEHKRLKVQSEKRQKPNKV